MSVVVSQKALLRSLLQECERRRKELEEKCLQLQHDALAANQEYQRQLQTIESMVNTLRNQCELLVHQGRSLSKLMDQNIKLLKDLTGFNGKDAVNDDDFESVAKKGS